MFTDIILYTESLASTTIPSFYKQNMVFDIILNTKSLASTTIPSFYKQNMVFDIILYTKSLASTTIPSFYKQNMVFDVSARHAIIALRNPRQNSDYCLHVIESDKSERADVEQVNFYWLSSLLGRSRVSLIGINRQTRAKSQFSLAIWLWPG